jgi:nicotinamide mononucleotide transporter
LNQARAAFFLGLVAGVLAVALRLLFPGDIADNLAALGSLDWDRFHARVLAQDGWAEVVGFVFGVSGVYLAAKGNVLNYPVGIVNVLTYCDVFWHVRLYADSVLQLVYFAMLCAGWRAWLRGGPQSSPLPITRAPRTTLIGLGSLVVVATALLTPLLAAVGGARPLVDTATAVGSLACQYLLNRKHVENWLGWIAVDLVYIPLYISRGLAATAVLYTVFLVLAVVGWREWKLKLEPGQSNF